ncbi:MAG: DUF4175 domain-containing protein [Gemmatimonadetes bacterium]|nr:DUF4175 domain-containing protein [Gemmatimonadota bacterium]
MSAASSVTYEALTRGVRRRWRLRTLLVGVGRGLLAAAAAATLLAAADLALDLTAAARRALRWAPLVAMAVPLARAAIRAGREPTAQRLGLLVDARSGAGNLFSTLQSPNTAGPVAEAFRARAAGRLAGLSPAPLVPLAPGAAWVPALVGGALALLLAAVAGGWLGPRWIGLVDAPTPSVARGAPAAPRGGAPASMGSLRWVVHPPGYTGLPPRPGREGEPLAALPGSGVELHGEGDARPPTLRGLVVGGDTLAPAAASGGWSARWTVEPDQRGVQVEVLDDGRVVERRVVPLRVLRDRPPTVELLEPERDVMLATPTGVVPVRAVARDDFGVAELELRWVRSRGSGESFDFEEGTWAWDVQAEDDGARTGSRALRLAELDLAPGDVLHVRATATDRNGVTGPGRGVSATRQIRIAREDELSEVTTLIGFPIQREREPLLSQRMIILLTEELQAEAAGMSRAALLDAAEDIADEQRRLRTRMGEQIFSRATGADTIPTMLSCTIS